MMMMDSPSQTAVLILGMHRSGTSCLAGSLQQRGLHLGKVHESDTYNRKGNREHDRVVALNNAVIEHSGGSWDAPVAEVSWLAAHERERDKVVAELSASAGAWGFKDPRTLVTLPFWLPALGDNPRYVGAFRHPAQVVRSLQSRGRMSLDGAVAAAAWYSYNELLLQLHARAPFPLVSFDLPEPEYLATLERVARSLGFEEGAGSSAEVFFESGLRHGRGEHQVVDDKLLDLYQRLLEASFKMEPY